MSIQRNIAFIEDDEDVLASYTNPGFAQRLADQDLPYGIVAFHQVDDFRAHLHAAVDEVVCLVTDLSDVGWGGLEEIPIFKDRERVKFPIIVSTGMRYELVTNPEMINELRAIDVRMLRKPYSTPKLISEIKALVGEVQARANPRKEA